MIYGLNCFTTFCFIESIRQKKPIQFISDEICAFNYSNFLEIKSDSESFFSNLLGPKSQNNEFFAPHDEIDRFSLCIRFNFPLNTIYSDHVITKHEMQSRHLTKINYIISQLSELSIDILYGQIFRFELLSFFRKILQYIYLDVILPNTTTFSHKIQVLITTYL